MDYLRRCFSMDRDYLILLYDIYGSLLTSKQKKYFEDYYFNNFTLSEISENEKVSRNAVSKAVNLVEKKLIFYEEKLSLYKKNNNIMKVINNIKDEKIVKEILKNI